MVYVNRLRISYASERRMGLGAGVHRWSSRGVRIGVRLGVALPARGVWKSDVPRPVRCRSVCAAGLSGGA